MYSDYELELKTNPKTNYWNTESLVDALEYSLLSGLDVKIDSYIKKQTEIFTPPIKTIERASLFGGYLPRDCYEIPVSEDLSCELNPLAKYSDTQYLPFFLANLQDLGAVNHNANYLDFLPSLASTTFIASGKNDNYATTFFIEKIGESKRWKFREEQIEAYRVTKIYHCNDGTTDGFSFCYGCDRDLNFRPLLPKGIADSNYDPEIDDNEAVVGFLADLLMGLNLCLDKWIQRNIRPNFYIKSLQESLTTRFSVFDEEVKSLFYARDLNPTSTGKKKPLLHWVKSHHRRLKSGIDIEIAEHLRGTSRFDFFGMNMDILSPIHQKAGRRKSKGFGKIAKN